MIRWRTSWTIIIIDIDSHCLSFAFILTMMKAQVVVWFRVNIKWWQSVLCFKAIFSLWLEDCADFCVCINVSMFINTEVHTWHYHKIRAVSILDVKRIGNFLTLIQKVSKYLKLNETLQNIIISRLHIMLKISPLINISTSYDIHLHATKGFTPIFKLKLCNILFNSD